MLAFTRTRTCAAGRPVQRNFNLSENVRTRRLNSSWRQTFSPALWVRWSAACLLFLAMAVSPVLASMASGPARAADSPLAGQVIVATQQIADPNFARTVIVLVEHDQTGGWGLVLNRPAGEVTLAELANELGADVPVEDIPIPLHQGGPVELERGFILHMADYTGEMTITLDGMAAVSADIAVLNALSAGEGPRAVRALFGYAGWDAGQLEAEIARGDWVVRPLDLELLFGRDNAGKWRRALTLENLI